VNKNAQITNKLLLKLCREKYSVRFDKEWDGFCLFEKNGEARVRSGSKKDANWWFNRFVEQDIKSIRKYITKLRKLGFKVTIR
jgi:hypothetical protein